MKKLVTIIGLLTEYEAVTLRIQSRLLVSLLRIFSASVMCTVACNVIPILFLRFQPSLAV
jgi:hypothetical protein